MRKIEERKSKHSSNDSKDIKKYPLSLADGNKIPNSKFKDSNCSIELYGNKDLFL